MVVTTAMATIIVKSWLLKTPIDNPMLAMMTSVEPRALSAVARPSDSAPVNPPSQPPAKAPRNFPILATAMIASVNSSSVGSRRVLRSMLRPATAKKIGLKNAMINPRSWPSICSVKIGDCPTSIPATKAPSAV